LEPLVLRVLTSRGLLDSAAISAFFEPALRDLHDPSLLPGVDRAAQRLLHAARHQEPIVIYADYDVDGITAAAILFHTLRALVPGCAVRTYVPHRLDEGYGLNDAAIAALGSGGARVIVSVDCGITALAPARVARALALDLLITDHHALPAGDLPDAYALVHPRLPGSRYPFADLCGAGVAFKLAWRLATLASGSARADDHTRAVLLDNLALAAMGTVADIVPLVGENRVIAYHGLRRVPTTAIAGLGALIDASRLAGERMDAEKVGFILAPRLNACGRMGHAKEAIELLTTATGPRAAELARQLTRLNEDRQRTERAIAAQAEALALEHAMTGADRRAIVLAHDDWHPGVVGICCSRLVALFHRPTILMRRENARCHGSARSIDAFNLHHALSRCADLLDRFGGHEMAAGLSLPVANLAEFTDRFTAIAAESITDDDLVPTLRYDCEASLDELTEPAVRQLDRLGPFGRSNPAPRLLVRSLRVTRRPEPFGRNAQHLSVFAEHKGRPMRLIGWNWRDRADAIHSGATIDALIEPKITEWNARRTVEPVLSDISINPAPR
ncbi:MAG TPA: single-stranded-DNA-specific exonuclease RecJ, partial [Phycisphaerales bacterium]|nr:single-stranded-DNA-specific exonuclease RecJ [Phycisphaerales bacterium]